PSGEPFSLVKADDGIQREGVQKCMAIGPLDLADVSDGCAAAEGLEAISEIGENLAVFHVARGAQEGDAAVMCGARDGAAPGGGGVAGGTEVFGKGFGHQARKA